jgi:tetratricopeptide (TPR) repeat protein
MPPIDPNDLIRRPKPEDENSATPPASSVRLERFQELEHVIRDSPILIDPYIELGKIYMQADRWSDARRVFEKAVERFPEDQSALQLYEDSQLARSKQLLEVSAREHAAEPCSATEKKLQECKLEWNSLRARIFRARLARHPDSLENLLPLAEALEWLDQRDEAIAALQKAAQHPPLRTRASFQLGKLLETAGDVPAALSAYRRAALFRLPPPDRDLKLQALRAAADLSERYHLFHFSRRYLRLLQDLQPEEDHWKQRLQIVEARL